MPASRANDISRIFLPHCPLQLRERLTLFGTLLNF
jgi:hypothetical protein